MKRSATAARARSGRTLRARQVVPLALLVTVFGLALRVALSARLERADFTFNNGTEVSTLDPATVTGVPEGRVIRAIFEGLCVKHPETLEPMPGMAESWEISPDFLTYTFHIREDARWTNGDPVTAHDFTWSFERFLSPATGAEYAYQLWYVKGAKPYTLLPDDRWYTADLGEGLWAREGEDGRWRIGLHQFALDGLPHEGGGPVLAVAANEPLEQGATIARIPGGAVHVPFQAMVRAVNPKPPASLEAWRADPYEAGWLVEVDADLKSLRLAKEGGSLVDAATFRAEHLYGKRVAIRALDERTLEIELVSPTPFFLDLMAFYPLFPVNRRGIEEAREAFPDTWQIEWLRPERIVTNGPYVVAERRVNDRIRLVKNPDYWDADSVAMRTVDVLAVESYQTMLNLYLTGEVEWIDRIATNVIPRLLPREDFDPTPYLGSYFYRVNVTRRPFDDPRVRRALALTIDRKDICEKIMKAGQLPFWSFVPPGMHGYTNAEMAHAADPADYEPGFQRDIQEAKALLAEAGFGPGGKPLPTIEIHYNTSEAHRDIAEVVADSWKRHLGMSVKLLNQEWKVYLDTQSNLDYDVSRSAWIGDYPDPNTFLDMFVTGGENNKTGWGNARYDELVAGAAREFDRGKRLEMLREAEAIILEELPILPIYAYVTQNMTKPRLGGFHANVQDEHFPKFFYWMDDAELARERAKLPPGTQIVEPGGPPEGLYSPAQERARRTDGTGQ